MTLPVAHVERKEVMTFEDHINLLIAEDFYLHRAFNHFGSNKFHVMIGKRTILYLGEGGTLSEALDKAVDNHDKGEAWPPMLRERIISRKESDDRLKGLGIDLD